MAGVPLVMHGLEFRFGGGDAPRAPATVDVYVDERAPVRDEPPHDVAMRCDPGGWTILYALRSAERWTLVYPGLMEIDVSADGRTVRFRLHPDTDERYVGIMLIGAVSALCCMIRGDVALHASAVEFDGGVVAVAGPSGQGKSTTASLLALAGAPVFTDDLLRVGVGDPPTAHRGATESRLRESAAQLADLAAEVAGVRTTADGRTALAFPVSQLATAPLRAVVLPRPTAELAAPWAEPVSGLDGFKELHACLRLVGWRDRAMISQGFDDIGELLDRVPLYRLHIPWGAPYRAHHGIELLDCLAAVLHP